MNLITDTWRQLVRRRLWPVALLLVAAAAALPFLLGKAPEAPPAPVAPANAAAATADTAETQPVVALVDDRQAPAKRRRVLGAQKDPFEPRPLPKVKKSKKSRTPAKAATAKATATPSSAGSPAGSSISSGAPASSGTPSETVAPSATPAPKKTFPANSLEIRFGRTDKGADMKSLTLQRLRALPSAGSPVLVFMGLEDGGRTAGFMISGDATAEGDGTCAPSPESCETLSLHAGDTEFVTVAGTGTSTNGQYEIDLRAIHAKSSK